MIHRRYVDALRAIMVSAVSLIVSPSHKLAKVATTYSIVMHCSVVSIQPFGTQKILYVSNVQRVV